MLGFVEMDEMKKIESHPTSAAAFVEGGIQEACDDACSICLEAFCNSDPSTVITILFSALVKKREKKCFLYCPLVCFRRVSCFSF